MKKLLSLIFTLLLANGLSAKQWAIFYAEASNANSATGHVFVSFVQEAPLLQSTVIIGTWGFHPLEPKVTNLSTLYQSYSFGIFGPVKGEIRDNADRRHDLTFAVEITKEELQACLETKDKWKTKQYKLTSNNCIEFLRSMAENIKSIRVPSLAEIEFTSNAKTVAQLKTVPQIIKAKWPSQFIKLLKESNPELEKETADALPDQTFFPKQTLGAPLQGTVYSDHHSIPFFEEYQDVYGALIDYDSFRNKDFVYSVSVFQRAGSTYLVLNKSVDQNALGQPIWELLDAVRISQNIGTSTYSIISEDCKVKGIKDNYIVAIVRNANVKLFKPVSAFRVDLSSQRLKTISDLSAITCPNISFGHYE